MAEAPTGKGCWTVQDGLKATDENRNRIPITACMEEIRIRIRIKIRRGYPKTGKGCWTVRDGD